MKLVKKYWWLLLLLGVLCALYFFVPQVKEKVVFYLTEWGVIKGNPVAPVSTTSLDGTNADGTQNVTSTGISTDAVTGEIIFNEQ